MLLIYVDNLNVFGNLAKQLKNDLDAHIVNKINEEDTVSNENLYIIFGMHRFTESDLVPKNYIVFQLEQTTWKNNYFNDRYIKYLKNALEVWDYSLVNYRNLSKLGIFPTYIKLGKLNMLDNTSSLDNISNLDNTSSLEKDIDIFIYGVLNKRRLNIVNNLKNKYPKLKIIAREGIYGEDLLAMINKSHCILNIHYNDISESILEAERLSYLLSINANINIITEKSCDPLLDKLYESYVTYIDTEISENEISLPEISKSKLEFFKTEWPSLDKYKDLINSNSLYINSSQIKLNEANTIVKNGNLILRLPPYEDKDLPPVSIVTITYNRKKIFANAIRNFQIINYPSDKLEWIIVDDSDDNNSLSSILPEDSRIKYYKLKTDGRLFIGKKRNFGIEHSSHNYIVFMDDDDYYYPFSVYARIATLLTYREYSLVGVAKVDIYDAKNKFSARVGKGTYISEASMGFRRSFFNERKFKEENTPEGEGYYFCKDRYDKIITIPSCFNLIAITHNSNYTLNARSYEKFKDVGMKDNILSSIDDDSRKFINNLFK
jgi:hypothetical protein